MRITHTVVFVAGMLLACWLAPSAVLAQFSYAVETDPRHLKTAATVETVDIRSLEPGRHHFYFTAGTRAGGTPLLVPVIVVKGFKPGKRLLIVAAIHGDELNGIAVTHDLAEKLDPGALAGSVIMVPGLNQTGIERHSRYFAMSDSGGSQADLNRLMVASKGKFKSGAATFASHVWEKLLRPNADLVIDLHTQSRGTTYPLFVFADFRNKAARRMAVDLMPDVIKDDAGEGGTLETSFIRAGVPAVTLEIGAPKVFQDQLVDRSINGIMNVMRRHRMLTGDVEKPTKKPYVGTDAANIVAKRGGLARIDVDLLEKVQKGQVLARVYDPFGQLLDTYTAPHAGMVLAIATDPVREPASLLVRILR